MAHDHPVISADPTWKVTHYDEGRFTTETVAAWSDHGPLIVGSDGKLKPPAEDEFIVWNHNGMTWQQVRRYLESLTP